MAITKGNITYIDGTGEPPDNGQMEHRVTALETRLDTVLPTLATKADLADLRSEVHKGFGEMVKWIVGTALGGLAVFITVMTFVLNNATPRSPVAPTPIVIQLESMGAAGGLSGGRLSVVPNAPATPTPPASR